MAAVRPVERSSFWTLFGTWPTCSMKRCRPSAVHPTGFVPGRGDSPILRRRPAAGSGCLRRARLRQGRRRRARAARFRRSRPESPRGPGSRSSAPEASSIATRRNRPFELEISQRIRFPSGNHSAPSHSVVPIRRTSPAPTGMSTDADLGRDGQDPLPVGRQAGPAVVFAEAQGRRAVRRPEKQSVAVVEEHLAAVAREIGEKAVVGGGELALLTRGRRGAADADLQVPAREQHAPVGGDVEETQLAGAADDFSQLSRERHGHERQDCCPAPASAA